MRPILATAAAAICLASGAGSAAAQPADSGLKVEINYIAQAIDRPPVRSNLIAWPEDEGLQGARLGIEDNATTGKFLKHDYSLVETDVLVDGDAVAAARQVLDGGPKLAVLNVPGAVALAIADLPEAADDLLINAGSADDELRNEECRANMLHTLPSRAMLSDALMQFLSKRQWGSIMLIEGNRPGDKAFAEALRRSAEKFRLDIDYEKQWLEDADIRRNAAQEVPVFTQEGDYDIIVVADEDEDFGHYVLFNTWLPRPVAGSAGMRPVAWDRVVEQWGAAQLQSRFVELADRDMTSVDYAAWAAVRSIGEAVTRTNTAAPAEIRGYILSDEFGLAAFKGAKVSFRTWNGQMRQPIPLVHANALVASAPIEGFLHQRTELDTLGIDEPESVCEAME